ncbi:MAG: (d)CMP kinase [Clostridiales bacterium]|nr:(d)CMP kinase [Clostridiales bacterium]
MLRTDLSQDENRVAVALDGPAGSGKSTIAKLVAKELGFIYIDTGAMYRSVAFYCIDKDIDYNNELEVISNLDNINITIQSTKIEQRYLLNDVDVTDLLRSPEVSEGASKVASYKAVREKLVALQRECAAKQSVIMDGRDIGTNVLPNAEVKVFMEGKVEERAKRRFEELELKGITTTYEEILEDIKKRDYNDSHREYNPLKRAEDAVLLDTTYMTIEEVKDYIVEEIKKHLKEG